MPGNLRITYLFESTDLWGGTKVGLEQSEALSDAGYDVTVLSKDAGPSWYDFRLPVTKVSAFDAGSIPESDLIVGTYWPTVRAAVESRRGKVVHLCQGYEGDYLELHSLKTAIDEVYSYKIPKLTVSPHLDHFLRERFKAETYYVGQMLNRDVFYPAQDRTDNRSGPKNILIVGPFEVDFKNVAFTLRGVSLAKGRLAQAIRITRVSQFPLTDEERTIVEPDAYHFHLPHNLMGDIYRTADLFVSMSKEAEGFGLPALEAMACGVPTILSEISSYTAFDTPADYAFFLTPSDPEILTGAVIEVLGNNSLLERLVRRGLDVAGKYTREMVVKRLNAAIEKIVYGTSRPGKSDTDDEGLPKH